MAGTTRIMAHACSLIVCIVVVACSSSTSSIAASPPGSTVSASPSEASPSSEPVDPSSLTKGELFPVMPPGDWEGRFTKAADTRGEKKVTIDIVALGSKPAFSPAIITGSAGQVLQVTVHQADDLSANFQHNFSIDALSINKDIPKGPGHSITVTVKLPASGSLGFYCSYHVVAEQHAGLFLVTKS